jgi:hypothetical protein
MFHGCEHVKGSLALKPPCQPSVDPEAVDSDNDAHTWLLVLQSGLQSWRCLLRLRDRQPPLDSPGILLYLVFKRYKFSVS